MKVLKYYSYIVLTLLLCALLAACNDSTNTPDITSTSTSTLAPASVSVTTTLPPVTDSSGDVDPVRSLPVAPTVALDASGVQSRVTPTPSPLYGSLVTPPRGLTPAQVTPNDSNPVLDKGSFVATTRNGLFLLSADGQNGRTLAAGSSFSEPKVSPDGTRIVVFRSDPISLQRRLIIMGSGGQSKNITEAGGPILNADWSPDGKTLALTRVTDTNNDGTADENDAPNIWLYEVAADRQRQLTEGGNPAWSSDGVRLIYVIPGPYADDIDPATRKPRRAPNSLAVYNLQSNAKRVLLDTKKLDLTLPNSLEEKLRGQVATVRNFREVAWNPDNKRLTVSADAVTKSGTFVGLVLTVTLEDTTPKVVAAGGDTAGRVEWAADGKHLAFEVAPRYPVRATSAFQVAISELSDDGSPQPTRVYLGNPATRSETRRPLWLTPSQLAYVETDAGILTVYNTDGSGEKRLVSGVTGFDVV